MILLVRVEEEIISTPREREVSLTFVSELLDAILVWPVKERFDACGRLAFTEGFAVSFEPSSLVCKVTVPVEREISNPLSINVAS